MDAPAELPSLLAQASHWPVVPVLTRVGLAIAIGLFIGLEREHSRKTGVRTFALTALMGCLGGLTGQAFALVAAGFVTLLVLMMNGRELLIHKRLALTTSTALMVVAFCGILCGMGHTFTPIVVGVLTAALLAWKQSIAGFVGGLSDKELRSAILLAVLTFVVFPVLPAHPVDPWGLIEPQSNWASVIIIAAVGFVNYMLLKTLGPRGMEVTAFFGGLVNSRKVIVELATRLKEVGAPLLPSAYRGILLATGAMLLRNGLIVIIFASQAAVHCAIPFTLMLLVSAVLWRRSPAQASTAGSPQLALESPFRLMAALKFGGVFLALNVAGALAQRNFGSASFYFVSILGGFLSSASSIASAATLISHNEISAVTGVNGVILSSLTSIVVNIPLIRSMAQEASFRRRVSTALLAVAAMGLVGVGLNLMVFDALLHAA
ncbi:MULTISPECIES: MgtC/SapB family protein [unclassified Corallococcus]|uniref:MgtC/SapB family protein n=1 Tax=unclassified Corallococcus TaxID=2685029 RepID=UPI001A8E2DBF|nr:MULTISPECIES: MgtC/SapB family protein [unclassified Corallococcus]MBN9687523.1 MgtC/SapB family protein [Corallococcus sp. NCSPR001]WAS88655.1 MgtC/SapB family protein [Corallococcus sp. NCRR]